MVTPTGTTSRPAAPVTLAQLPPAGQADVLAALAAVETADAPVPRTAYRALADQTLRTALETCLRAAGRVLLPVGAGFLTGYDDHVAARLATDGIGVLPPDDRAVLTAVLLFTVAIPRARGRIPADAAWTECEPIASSVLDDVKLPSFSVIRPAVRRLRDAGILRYASDPARGVYRGIGLGPQFARLTPAVVEALFEELVLLAEPDGLYAETILRRREARQAQLLATTAPDPADGGDIAEPDAAGEQAPPTLVPDTEGPA